MSDPFSQERMLEQQRLRGQFQADVQAEIAKSRSSFESELQRRRQAEEAKRKQQFEEALASQMPREQLGILGKIGTVRETAKREYAMKYRRQISPRELEQKISPIIQGYEQELAKSVETARSQQYTAISEDLSAWVEGERAGFESETSKWKTEQESKFEVSIKEWGSSWQPAGLGERISAYAKSAPYQPMKPFAGQEPYLNLLAGIVGTGESFIYGLANLFEPAKVVGVLIPETKGFPSPPLPRSPPTMSGALIGQGAEALTGQPSDELSKLKEMGSAYALGTVVGDVLLGYGLGKVFKPLTGELLGRGSKVDLWLYKHSKWYAARTPPSAGFVLMPAEGLPAGGEGLSLHQMIFNEKVLKAQDVAWGFAETPRTSLLMVIPQTGLPYAEKEMLPAWQHFLYKSVPAKALPTLTFAGGKLSSSGRLPSFKDFLTSTSGSATIQRMGSAPLKASSLLPELIFSPVVGVGSRVSLSTVLGLGAVLGLKGVSILGAESVVSQRAKAETISRAVTSQVSQIRQVSLSVTMTTAKLNFGFPKALPRPRFEDNPILSGLRKPRKRGKGEKDYHEYLFPYRGVKSAAKFILGKDGKGKNRKR